MSRRRSRAVPLGDVFDWVTSCPPHLSREAPHASGATTYELKTYSPPEATFSSSYDDNHEVSAISYGVQPAPGAWVAATNDVNQVDLPPALALK